jgi:hypothetical protein
VLHLDPEEVEARARHRAVDVGIGVDDGAADDLLALAQLLLDGVVQRLRLGRRLRHCGLLRRNGDAGGDRA